MKVRSGSLDKSFTWILRSHCRSTKPLSTYHGCPDRGSVIPRRTIARCARSIVRSMNLKPGDGVLVRGGAHSRQLLEDIAFECYRAGALPLITHHSDELDTRVMRGIPTDTLEQVPRHLLGAYEKMDCVITIETYEDPSTMASFPRSKLEARTRAGVPLRKIVMGEGTGIGKKWCYAGWPTRKAAKYYGIEYELYERFIIGGMTVPFSTLRRRCETIASLLDGSSRVHVTDPEGSDFELRIKGRRVNLDDGFVSDEDVEANDQGNNLPAGEVFIAPHETWGSGTLFCPLAKDRFTGKIIKDVELSFEKGKLDLDGVKASENRDAVVKSFRQALRVDEKTQKRLRTLNVAELGIGCNPRITKAIGYTLTDEKIVGSAHLAFGSNFSYGGTSKSAMHWDFVTVPKVTLAAHTDDGSERIVIKNGKLQRK